MTIRTSALAWLTHEARTRSAMAEAVRAASKGTENSLFTSKTYAPAKSRTSRWSWWHKVPCSALDGDGSLLLVCEKRDVPGFHVLAVPRQFLRERRKRFADFAPQPFLNLMISAEPEDEFVDGPSQVSFRPYLIP